MVDYGGNFINGLMGNPDEEEQKKQDLAQVLQNRAITDKAPYEQGGVTGGANGATPTEAGPTVMGDPGPAGNDLPDPNFGKYATPVSGNDATVDTSKWDTDGFGAPKYTATNFGTGLGGWDPTKWADPNHQTPKYVVGRILQEASGNTRFLKDPKQREQAVANIIKAYPGAKFDGKDKITMPDGGVVDIFRGAGSGEYGVAWAPVTGPGGQPLPGEGRPMGGGMAGPSAMASMLNRRYSGMPEQFPDNQFMNGSLENPVQFGSKPLYTQNPLYQEMMQRLLFTPKQ